MPPQDEELVESEQKSKALNPGWGSFIKIIAALFILYHLLFISDFLILFADISIAQKQHTAVHLAIVLFLTFLITPAKRGVPRGKPPWYDIILAVLSLVPLLYYVAFYQSKIIYEIGDLLPEHVILGWVLILLVIEAARRLLGPIFASVVTFFVLYTLFCDYFPGVFHGRGYPLDRVGEFMFLGASGILGIPVRISATVIILFLFFSQLLLSTGAGKYFIDVAYSMMGQVRGGPAKVAVVASGFFGMLSGSSAGNVAATGVFTIPMMKKIGYKPEFAGGVEAVASLGGMMMPPIMASVIFILAEFVEMPYVEVMLAAFIPAALYYFALFMMVDLQAAKTGMRGLPRSELPPFLKTVWGGLWYLAPVAVLLYLLIVPMYTPSKSALGAMVALWGLAMLRKQTRLGLRKLIDNADQAVRMLLMVAVACAAGGILIGAVGLTGLGVNLSAELVNLSGGNVFLLLLLAAVTSFVLGMEMGPVPVYLFLAVLVAPALAGMGIPPLAAHLFVYYFGMVSLITPPVCSTAFVAAGIAGGSPMRTGLQASRIGIAAYIVPFAFALGPALLLIGSPIEIVLTGISAIIGIAALAVAASGYLFNRVGWLQRIPFLAAAILLVMPGWTFDIVGIGVLAGVLLWHMITANVNPFQRKKLPSV